VPTLRIKHAGNRVVSSFEGGETPISDDRPFSFQLSAQDAADVRWYLEDYPIYPTDPQPAIAKRIERRMAEAGRELFRQVFEHSDVWQAARHRINDTRIEIETEVDDSLVPWELLRDPVADLRKNAIALTPAMRICVQRDVANQALAWISPSAPADAEALMTI
jgi:hypothetical protein